MALISAERDLPDQQAANRLHFVQRGDHVRRARNIGPKQIPRAHALEIANPHVPAQYDAEAAVGGTGDFVFDAVVIIPVGHRAGGNVPRGEQDHERQSRDPHLLGGYTHAETATQTFL